MTALLEYLDLNDGNCKTAMNFLGFAEVVPLKKKVSIYFAYYIPSRIMGCFNMMQQVIIL